MNRCTFSPTTQKMARYDADHESSFESSSDSSYPDEFPSPTHHSTRRSPFMFTFMLFRTLHAIYLRIIAKIDPRKPRSSIHCTSQKCRAAKISIMERWSDKDDAACKFLGLGESSRLSVKVDEYTVQYVSSCMLVYSFLSLADAVSHYSTGVLDSDDSAPLLKLYLALCCGSIPRVDWSTLGAEMACDYNWFLHPRLEIRLIDVLIRDSIPHLMEMHSIQESERNMRIESTLRVNNLSNHGIPTARVIIFRTGITTKFFSDFCYAGTLALSPASDFAWLKWRRDPVDFKARAETLDFKLYHCPVRAPRYIAFVDPEWQHHLVGTSDTTGADVTHTYGPTGAVGAVGTVSAVSTMGRPFATPIHRCTLHSLWTLSIHDSLTRTLLEEFHSSAERVYILESQLILMECKDYNWRVLTDIYLERHQHLRCFVQPVQKSMDKQVNSFVHEAVNKSVINMPINLTDASSRQMSKSTHMRRDTRHMSTVVQNTKRKIQDFGKQWGQPTKQSKQTPEANRVKLEIAKERKQFPTWKQRDSRPSTIGPIRPVSVNPRLMRARRPRKFQPEKQATGKQTVKSKVEINPRAVESKVDVKQKVESKIEIKPEFHDMPRPRAVFLDIARFPKLKRVVYVGVGVCQGCQDAATREKEAEAAEAAKKAALDKQAKGAKNLAQNKEAGPTKIYVEDFNYFDLNAMYAKGHTTELKVLSLCKTQAWYDFIG